MTARILQFARKHPAPGVAVEASGSEPGAVSASTHGTTLPPSFLRGARLVIDARSDRTTLNVRPVDGHGVYRRPFGPGVWVYHPDDNTAPPQCVTVAETRRELDAFTRSHLDHPCNQQRSTK